MDFIRQTKSGIEIFVRASPNAKIEKIDGVEKRDDDKLYLRIKTRAIAEDGAANIAIIKLISKILKIPKSEIILTSGNTNRIKTLLVKSNLLDIEAIKSALIQSGEK
jgi:uncharacterized protein